MKIEIIISKEFEKSIKGFFKNNKLIVKDFDSLKKELCSNPESGDLIAGTGGIRKIRIKSASRGKSGGFRVYYFYNQNKLTILFIWIIPKNEDENINDEDKAILKKLTTELKRK